jgi:DNA-binding response OmpR family regulator
VQNQAESADRRYLNRPGVNQPSVSGRKWVLVVEDEQDIAELLKHTLERGGDLDVDTVGTGDGALKAVAERTPDLVILDLNLPVLSGIEVCRLLRARPATASVPIIMLTARTSESDRVTGLDMGADDYITKPFSPKELVARVAAVLRRSAPASQEPAPVTYGPIILDREHHVVTDSGRSVHLTAKEFLLLEYFLEHRGRVVSRDRLLSNVWGYQYTGGTRTVDVHVRRLREKLPILSSALETVKQFGYRLAETPGAGAGGEARPPAADH